MREIELLVHQGYNINGCWFPCCYHKGINLTLDIFNLCVCVYNEQLCYFINININVCLEFSSKC